MSASPPTFGASLQARARASRRMQRWREGAIALGLRGCAVTAVAALLLIVIFVAREALPVLFDPETRKEASLHAFTSTLMWQPVGDVPKYGLLPLVLGTFKIVAVAMAFAVPVALLAALFASEFASARLREFLKPAIELLAGIPSVVLGFLALIVIATWVEIVPISR
jgi:phosphate transport system permease protein